ncbi:MAG: A/G-specific adenine glycosylase, partial [Nitrospinota bacterium]|nr:A/G-specific adenine glycosylase [Nitrospinota bacterium]
MKATAGKRKIQKALLGWFDTEQRDMPWRETRDPYPIWVSEIMLQQTQVKTVIPYFERWMKSFPNLQKLARSREETVLK